MSAKTQNCHEWDLDFQQDGAALHQSNKVMLQKLHGKWNSHLKPKQQQQNQDLDMQRTIFKIKQNQVSLQTARSQFFGKLKQAQNQTFSVSQRYLEYLQHEKDVKK